MAERRVLPLPRPIVHPERWPARLRAGAVRWRAAFAAGHYETLMVSLLVAVSLARNLAWASGPIWQGPDEQAHYGAIQFIAEHGRLPGAGEDFLSDEEAWAADMTAANALHFFSNLRAAAGAGWWGVNERAVQSERRPRTAVTSRVIGWGHHLPPLYYVLLAPFYRLVYPSDIYTRVFVLRLATVLLAGLAVLAAYGLARAAFPGDRAMRLTVAFRGSFQPMFAYLGAVVNTDMLLFLIATLVLWLGVRVLRAGLTWRRSLLLGLLLGAGLLTKPQIVGLAPGVAFVVLVELWKRRGARLQVAAQSLATAAVALVIAGPWMAHSVQVNGNPFYADWLRQLGRTPQPMPELSLAAYLRVHWAVLRDDLFVGYWANFGWLDTWLAPQYYTLLRAAVILAGAGLGVYATRWLRDLHEPATRSAALETGLILAFFALCTASLLVLYPLIDYTFMKANGIGRGIQGRYYLMPIAAHMALLGVGWMAWLPSAWQTAAHAVARLAALALNALALFAFWIPRYYG